CCAHEELRSVKSRHQVVTACGENDVLLAKYCSARYEDPSARLIEQSAHDMQGVCEYLKVEPIEMAKHLERGRAAIDHHRLGGLTQGRGGFSYRFLLRAMAADVLVEGHARETRRGTRLGAADFLLSEFRAAAHAVYATFICHALEIAAERC